MPKYNHMLDIAFIVISEEENDMTLNIQTNNQERPVIDWHDLTPKQQSELETLLEEWLDREEQEQEDHT